MPFSTIWSRLRSRIASRATRLDGKNRLPVRLGSNRIYILPTKAGVAFFILLVVLLLISINYNNPPGYLLTFLLAGIALVGIFHTHRGLSGLLIAPGSALPIFAGSRAEFPVMVANPSRWPRHGIQVGWARVETGPLKDVPAAEEQTFLPSLPAANRGELRPKRVVIATVFPLGLFRAWSWVALPLRCMVYPAPAPRASLLDQHNAAPDQGGERPRAGNPLEGEEYHGLRAYQPGDPLRRIAWKAVARGSELVSKEFGGAANLEEIVLDWDRLPDEEIEAKLSRLCRLVLDAEVSGRSYSLRIPGKRIPTGNGPRQMHACLTALALFSMLDAQTLDEAPR
ncbi:DUF58 domain-containing protein [Desulfonatronum sp. SC1]|uniref:DUF58 domain-containing protein n=1 Tax=Desulfonatronum sp. SC1 TaxID=2109626 RepID=UPI000D322C7D|nr:DUF58 domain-containing protein [Desulfonatronum sp. SC1]PTN36353.1 DUF58 domain-containing protein [Desulfonatronum sp. SC1]